LEVFVILVGSYLIGSIPVAYIVVRKQADVDIRETGSGNAGGFNAYVVTKSRLTGILVGVLDAGKGFAPVLAVGHFFPNSFLFGCIALLGAILGHNFPIWTGLKGGRGLSTSAGGMFSLGFSYTVVWCSIWIVTKYLLKRDILVSNVTAILTTPLVLWLLPWEWVSLLIAAKVENWTFVFFSCVLSTILLLSHLDAVKDIWKGPPKERPDKSTPHS
jgi:glycerol-3-phosphate acyltransferase PlsY